MSANRTESLHFYDYLCWKTGSKKVVKGRRLSYIANDTFSNKRITSGSRGEGLDLKGSDTDLMIVDPNFIAYESEREAIKIDQRVVLFMDTTDTQPCFTHLCLYDNYSSLEITYTKLLEQHGSMYLLSNQLYKQYFLKISNIYNPLCNKIHGPCVSDDDDDFDYALCIKCEKWISPAVPWISRPRSSWLSPKIISKITMSGVLFVPIGLKGSKHEDLEWRISFSVAEKFLIFSFNHTQLLCYVLLKIVLKEIIEKDKDLKGLLCSYYLKTLMFWISDDSDPTVWRPDNIIQCFMACLQRLLYSIEHSVLLHYFILDLNFFSLSLSKEFEKKKRLINLLKQLYQQGILCFSASETLLDYNRFPTGENIPKQLNINTKLVHELLQIISSKNTDDRRSHFKLLNSLIHHSKTDVSRDIFIFCMSKSMKYVPQTPYLQHAHNNKHQYFKYKFDLSHLLIGLQSDAVTGWLMLASFFYVHEYYLTSLDLTNYALSKLTDEKCCSLFSIINPRIIMTSEQESALEMMKNEKLITILKALTINILHFVFKSHIIPKELQQDVGRGDTWFQPLTFAHFLRFLCFYHLHEHFSSLIAITQLRRANKVKYSPDGSSREVCLHASILLGIACQMKFGTDFAKKFFTSIAGCDKYNFTSIATRLQELNMDY